MTNSGLQLKSSERWWGCFIGLVGDWPWLAKCGLDRSFMNVLKHKGPENGAVRDCKGICHLCSAGKPNYPYEQINSKTPLWEASILQETPFPDPSPFEIVPHTEGQLPALYHYDLFHCFHLGMGKNFWVQLCHCWRLWNRNLLWTKGLSLFRLPTWGGAVQTMFKPIAKESQKNISVGTRVIRLPPGTRVT